MKTYALIRIPDVTGMSRLIPATTTVQDGVTTIIRCDTYQPVDTSEVSVVAELTEAQYHAIADVLDIERRLSQRQRELFAETMTEIVRRHAPAIARRCGVPRSALQEARVSYDQGKCTVQVLLKSGDSRVVSLDELTVLFTNLFPSVTHQYVPVDLAIVTYDTPPSDAVFEELKRVAIAKWKTMGDERYQKEKLGRIESLQNVGDNFMYILAMFDINNQIEVLSHCSPAVVEAVRERLAGEETALTHYLATTRTSKPREYVFNHTSDKVTEALCIDEEMLHKTLFELLKAYEKATKFSELVEQIYRIAKGDDKALISVITVLIKMREWGEKEESGTDIKTLLQ